MGRMRFIILRGLNFTNRKINEEKIKVRIIIETVRTITIIEKRFGTIIRMFFIIKGIERVERIKFPRSKN